MSLGFSLTQEIAMAKLTIVKKRKKNGKRLTMENVSNDQKYHEILQNSKIPNYKVKSSNWQSFATKE